ncbi:MAG: helicase-related protein [Gemmatimonas sp.]|uniref:helicase-related protein n=1 Tax=Gemmatimonas sp. TaxID=1962908 RepID=UPI00391F4370
MHETYRVTPLRRVQQLVARTLLPTLPPATVGRIALLRHQQAAVARLGRILDEHHGALLADDVGLGKTFVALALAHGYPHVHVIAPAGLRDMWRRAIARAGPAHAHVHSLHAYSRSTPTPLASRDRTLVIIDEAHHLRHKGTARYRAVAHAVVGCDVLLLSATPLHNHARDLQTLFALFRGTRADSLDPRQLATLIVRRTAAGVAATARHAPHPDAAAPSGQRPTVRTHAPVTLPQDRETLTRILALPAPLPAHDGAVAGALIRLGLLRAWCSSDAALAHAVRRRQLRGAALRDALRAGRHPTQQELHSWVVGDNEGQLAFPELLAAQEVESGPLVVLLQRHLDALAELDRHHAAHGHADPVRADMLRTWLARYPDTPIVAFSQFTRTIDALQRALADIAGVAVVTSRSGRIASGPIPRAEVLASFAPLAHGRPPPPPHQRIRLLLATDLVAEGVNLQDAGVVVHLDLPWTHALRLQRVGRCVRIGSPHPCVHVYRFAPARFTEDALRLEARLARKHALTRTLVGSTHNRRGARSAADCASAWYDHLQAWHDRGGTRPPASAGANRDGAPQAIDQPTAARPHLSPTPCQLAVLRGPTPGALVLLTGNAPPRLVAVTPRGRRWTVRTGPCALLTLMAAMDLAGPRRPARGTRTAIDAWHRTRVAIRGALRRWWQREQVQILAGQSPDTLTADQRAGLRTLQRIVRRLSAAERYLATREIDTARQSILAGYGAGHDAALRRWCALAPGEASATDRRAWIATWQRDTIPARHLDQVATTSGRRPERRRSSMVMRAVLLLVPD